MAPSNWPTAAMFIIKERHFIALPFWLNEQIGQV